MPYTPSSYIATLRELWAWTLRSLCTSFLLWLCPAITWSDQQDWTTKLLLWLNILPHELGGRGVSRVSVGVAEQLEGVCIAGYVRKDRLQFRKHHSWLPKCFTTSAILLKCGWCCNVRNRAAKLQTMFPYKWWCEMTRYLNCITWKINIE